MRITNLMMTQNAISYMNDNVERINSLNDKIASTKQFQTMSDDPTRAASALSLRSTLQTNRNYIDNDATVANWLDANELALKQMLDVGTTASTLLVQGANDTLGQTERASLATSIDGMLTQAVDLANSKHMDKYIFAGWNTNSATAPFQIDTTTDPAPPAVPTYRMKVNNTVDTHPIQVNISPGQTLTTNFNGDTVFKDFFTGLIQAREALKQNDSTLIQNSMQALQKAMDLIGTASTTNGARMRQLSQTTDTMTRTKTQIMSLLSEKEDVNMAEAISMLKGQENTYQAVLAVSQRATSLPGLFDRMR